MQNTKSSPMSYTTLGKLLASLAWKNRKGTVTHVLLSHQPYATRSMSIPSFVATPAEFLQYVQSLDLPSIISAFTHYQSRPELSPNGRLDDASTALWCDRMDALVVSNIPSFDITDVMIDD